MQVYADLFFVLNAGADCALLAAAARLLGLRVAPWRLAAGAALGGAYGLAALLVPVPALFSLPAAAAAAVLMAAAAYAPRPPRVFLRLLWCLYGAAALAAGLALAVAGGTGGGVPWWGLGLALGGSLLAGGAVAQRWGPGAPLLCLCDLEIEIAGRRRRCRALLDTGNTLRDPCGAGPAVVLHAPVLRGLVPEALLEALAAGPQALPAAQGAVAPAAAAAEPGLSRGDGWDAWARRIRLLPVQTVGAEASLLCGLRPDRVWLHRGRRRRPVRAVLAVSATALDPEGAFAALVPAVLVAPGAEASRGWWLI